MQHKRFAGMVVLVLDGSQPLNGTRADFPAAATTSRSPTARAWPSVSEVRPFGHGSAPRMRAKSPDPARWWVTTAARNPSGRTRPKGCR